MISEGGLNSQSIHLTSAESQNKAGRTLSIDGRNIGAGCPPYIVAEMSGNHNGGVTRALCILDAAKQSGADAVKIQNYRADTITIDHHGPELIEKGGLWDGRRLYELYEEAHTPWEWHPAIFDHASPDYS